jgi:hypothetical protein
MAAVLTGCSKDEEVDKFIVELDTFSQELMKKAENDGIDAAQKHFDDNSPALQKTYAEVAQYRGYQVSEETTSKLEASVTKNTTDVMKLKITFMTKSKDEQDKVGKLTDAYLKLSTDV